MHVPFDPDDAPSRAELDAEEAEARRPVFVRFTVPGHAQPAGSKRAIPVRRGGVLTGRAAVVDANPRAKEWQALVASTAWDAMMRAQGLDVFDGDEPPEPFTGPLGLDLVFTMTRPKGHYGSGRNVGRLRDAAPKFPTTRPDTTKLVRAVEDALTAIVWHDDAQVVEQTAAKIFGDAEHTRVSVWRV